MWDMNEVTKIDAPAVNMSTTSYLMMAWKEGEIDFSVYLSRGPIFEPLKDRTFFSRATVEGGAIALLAERGGRQPPRHSTRNCSMPASRSINHAKSRVPPSQALCSCKPAKQPYGGFHNPIDCLFNVKNALLRPKHLFNP